MLLAPGLVLVAGLVPPLVVKVPAALIAFGLVAAGNLLADRQVNVLHDRLKRQDLRGVVEHTLQVAVRLIEVSQGTDERTLRGNVMLLGKDRALAVAYRSGAAADEHEVRWGRGQGCVGRVLETGKTVISDDRLPVSLADAERSSRPWNMTAEQVRHTAERIGSVLSVPLRLPEGRRVVGVLSFDDRKPHAESLLSRPDIIEVAELVAKGFGSYLAELGVTEDREERS